MDNFYSKYSVETSGGGGGGGVTSLNSLTGALSLVAGSGITITPSGSNITISSTGSSGANTFLSNLTSPTAINQSLLFASGVPGNIQTADSGILLFAGNGGASSNSLIIQTGDDTGFGSSPINVVTGNALGFGEPSAAISLTTGQTDTNTSGNILLTTGSASTGGNSGSIILSPSAVFGGGTRGKIAFTDGSEGTAGQVWTSSDTSGNGFWAPASGGGSPASGSRVAAPNVSPTANTASQVLFSSANAEFDTNNYAATSNSLTAPATSLYWINLHANLPTPSANNALELGYSINGGSIRPLSNGLYSALISADTPIVNATELVSLTAGDTVQYWVKEDLGDTVGNIFVSIAEVAGGGSGGSSTWLSTEWASSDSFASSTAGLGPKPSIHADSTLSNTYQIVTSDIPAADTTDASSVLFLATGSILESTNTLNSGNIQIFAGNTIGTGQPGTINLSAGNANNASSSQGGGAVNLTAGSGLAGNQPGGTIGLNGGASTGTGAGGDINMVAGFSPSGRSGNILLAVNAGTPNGLIQLQPVVPAVVGQVWTATDTSGSGEWAPASGGGGAIQSATILLPGAQNFNGGGFTTAFPFTSADAVAGSTTAMIGTNQFVAQNTGPHLFNFTATSTNFAGTEWGQIAYQINAGSQFVFVLGTNANSAGAARVVPNGDAIVMLTAGDTLQFYSNTNGTTNWVAYQISLTDLTPR